MLNPPKENQLLEKTAERESLNSIKKVNSQLKEKQHIQEILNALPHIAMLLNRKRQLVLANHYMEKSGLGSLCKVLAKRPGEIVGCIYSDKTTGGCGSSKQCRYCNAVQTLAESLQSEKLISRECRITSLVEGETVNLDLRISSRKLDIDGQEYLLVSMMDISNEKRREALERVFYHDVINTASGLKTLIDLHIRKKTPLPQTDLHTLGKICQRLMDEITSQKDLMAAERGQLLFQPAPISAREAVKDSVDLVKHYNFSEDKKIIILNNEKISFISDLNILNRVLLNMLKNALEASSKGQTIWIGYQTTAEEIEFWVKNEDEMPEKVQSRIFYRSFSTKGYGRGLGTYSMRLFTENYLKGSISFISSQKDGTIFTIRLPLNPGKKTADL